MKARALFSVAILALSTAATGADSSVVPLYVPCQHMDEYAARVSALARLDISRGKMRLFVYYGHAPFGATRREMKEAKARVQVLRSRGIEAKLEASGDLVDCVWSPYWAAYQRAMKEAVESRFGSKSRSWQRSSSACPRQPSTPRM